MDSFREMGLLVRGILGGRFVLAVVFLTQAFWGLTP
jgi:hypothetical protein